MSIYIILKVTKKYLPIKNYILFKEATRQNPSCNFTKKWIQKQPPWGVLIKRSYENMQQIYRRPCRRVISIKLQSSFVEIAIRHGCLPVNLLHVFRTPFYKSTSGWLFLWLHHLSLLRFFPNIRDSYFLETSF